ncbi:MAG: hypothetical protein RID09_04555 [Coleofasciculus sp. G1-WW12-02]|uniref:hypothetical protein n=1 Tax=unclassified Coleofasciculus TaxID=2692782 RepID=UPI003303BC72
MEIGKQMDTIQQQITALNHKVDAIYQIIEQLDQKLSQCLPTVKPMLTVDSELQASTEKVNDIPVYANPKLLDSVMEHKDILIEDTGEVSQFHTNHNGNHHPENPLSADVQVQRLTAQLTAAYNRIAALEEQLLARRIHS